MTTASISPRTIFKHGLEKSGRQSAELDLSSGSQNVFIVHTGPARILSLVFEISESVSAGSYAMTWVFVSAVGGTRTIAGAVDVAGAAQGDFFYSPGDGTGIVACVTGTGLPTAAFHEGSSSLGAILTPGTVRLNLGTTPAAGKGRLSVHYRPLLFNAVIVNA